MRLRLGEIKERIVATEDSIKDGGILKQIGPLWVNRIGHLPSHVSSLILNTSIFSLLILKASHGFSLISRIVADGIGSSKESF